MHTNNENNLMEKFLVSKATVKGIPLSSAFELTPLCNMDCQMCYIRLSREEQEREHRILTPDEWLFFAQQLKKTGTLFLLLTGGEVLLYPHFFDLYAELKKMGFILTINTNGTLITKETADFFADNMPRRINLTIYGANNQTYSAVTGNANGFTQTLRAIELLKSRNISVKLNYSLLRQNMRDLPDILCLADQLHLPLECNTYIFPCSRKESHIFDFNSRVSPAEAACCELSIKKHDFQDDFCFLRDSFLENCEQAIISSSDDRTMKCRAGKSSCWVNWKGQMMPCVFLDDPAVNLLECPVDSAWKVIKSECAKILLPEKCCHCQYRHSCNICAAASRWETNNYSIAPDYLCKYMETTKKALSEKS